MHVHVLVFVSGAAVMVLEIVAARFFAPYIGTSFTVWTSVIGVVMAGLSAGYCFGGALGDAWKSERRLRMIVLAAAVWVGFLAAFRQPLIGTFTVFIHSAVVLALTATVALLLVPSVLLGAVTPYAVRLNTGDVAHAGRSAGRLSALSTLGSIIGTFLAGFALVPAMGTTAILFACAGVLGCVALCRTSPRSLTALVAFLAMLVLLSRAEAMLHARMLQRHGIVLHQDSPYGVLRVRETKDGAGTLTRYLEIDHGNHAAWSPSDPTRHVFTYTEYYNLGDAYRPDMRRALLIGGGGYTVAKDFLERHPEASIDVLEIDPAVTALAKRYFGLAEDERLRVTHEDARRFLNRGGPADAPGSALGTYSVIYGDAFRSEVSVPFHLATTEAARRIHALLDDDGVYVLNVIASEEGKRSQILRAEVATLREVFPVVAAYRVPLGDDVYASPTSLENVTIIASKKPMAGTKDARLNAMLKGEIDLAHPHKVAALTDDYAPVEAMLNL